VLKNSCFQINLESIIIYHTPCTKKYTFLDLLGTKLSKALLFFIANSLQCKELKNPFKNTNLGTDLASIFVVKHKKGDFMKNSIINKIAFVALIAIVLGFTACSNPAGGSGTERAAIELSVSEYEFVPGDNSTRVTITNTSSAVSTSALVISLVPGYSREFDISYDSGYDGYTLFSGGTVPIPVLTPGDHETFSVSIKSSFTENDVIKLKISGTNVDPVEFTGTFQ
jgi:hypothetical protein